MTTSLLRPTNTSTLLARLIDSPDLVRTVRGLTPPTFSALVRHVGVEDAGEIVALATTEQLVAAFDEDLFVNDRPGERETFDSERFVVWLEVLLEAGDSVAARRVTELSDEFVVRALSSIVLVIDHDELMLRMGEGGEDARMADKAIESCLSEEIEGYLLISLAHQGWDAALALILALDRDHHEYLVRILDRCAALSDRYVEDLDELTTVLSDSQSLSEDVEAEREERRSRQGYIEPRAARSFLAIARKPWANSPDAPERDAVTRGYFRGLERPKFDPRLGTGLERTPGLLGAIGEVTGAPLPRLPGDTSTDEPSGKSSAFVEAMRLLGEQEPRTFAERVEELAYLTNVITAGAPAPHGRFSPSEAADAAFATVALGAELEVLESVRSGRKPGARATAAELSLVLRGVPADILFRKASSTLIELSRAAACPGLLCSVAELDEVLGKRPASAAPRGKARAAGRQNTKPAKGAAPRGRQPK